VRSRSLAGRRLPPLVFGFFLVGCHREKAVVRAELLRGHNEWYRAAWGAAPDEKALGTFDRRFECLWGEIERKGRDPKADLQCLALRWNSVARCHRETVGVPPADLVLKCGAAMEAPCAMSVEGAQALTLCK